MSKEKQIKIPPIRKEVVRLTIVGDSPLLVNKFSEKAKTELDEKHQKKAKGARQARNPEAEFNAARYIFDKKRDGVPASGLKNAAVSACRFTEGVPMTRAKGSFFVLEEVNGLVPIDCKSGAELDERIVRVGKFGNKQPMTRYRPVYHNWSITFKVVYNPDIISADQLANLFETAGFAIGLCEYRPEKSGNLGMFHVQRR